MNKKGISILVALFFISITLIGCSDKENKEALVDTTAKEADEATSNEEQEHSDELNRINDSEDELLEVSRELSKNLDILSYTDDREEFDKLRKDTFVNYDFYAPLDEFEVEFQDYRTEFSNEKITINQSYFIYEFDYVSYKVTLDGTELEPSYGHESFEIIRNDEGEYRINVIR